MAQDEQDDAARAFEDLTAEVRVMRRAVEALEAKKPIDYAPTLAEFAQELEELTGATAAMARRPAMALTPESYAAELRHAQSDAVKAVSAELYRAQAVTHNLESALGRVRTREEQHRWIIWAATGGVAAGAMLTLGAVKMLGS